jgi:hypothetical protein
LNRIEVVDWYLLQQCAFFIRRRFHLRLFEGSARSARAKCGWLRVHEFQARLDAATGNRDRLRRELDRRLETIEELKQKVVDPVHQVSETKAEAEKEIQRMKRTR